MTLQDAIAADRKGEILSAAAGYEEDEHRAALLEKVHRMG